MKISQFYRIEDGPLEGTEIEPIMGMVAVRYPHRKSKDLYVPPMEVKGKKAGWHCCQENCDCPDFDGDIQALVTHLERHAGKLFKKLKPVTAKTPAHVVVSLPVNPWAENDNRGANPDRRVVVEEYRSLVARALEKQGIGIVEATNGAKQTGRVR